MYSVQCHAFSKWNVKLNYLSLFAFPLLFCSTDSEPQISAAQLTPSYLSASFIILMVCASIYYWNFIYITWVFKSPILSIYQSQIPLFYL